MIPSPCSVLNKYFNNSLTCIKWNFALRVHYILYLKKEIKHLYLATVEWIVWIQSLNSNFITWYFVFQGSIYFQFLLKHETMCHLREVPEYPSSVCPTYPGEINVLNILHCSFMYINLTYMFRNLEMLQFNDQYEC